MAAAAEVAAAAEATAEEDDDESEASLAKPTRFSPRSKTDMTVLRKMSPRTE